MWRWILLGGALAFAAPAQAAGPSCAELARAARAGSHDAAVAWALPVARAVVDAARRIEPGTGAPTLDVVALGPVTGAWYCRGRDAVYVTEALARYAHLGRASDGADFLAFVVAHELAHRRFDAAGEGEARAFEALGAAAAAREAAADGRAAFLAALARNPWSGRGFSPWRLERDGTLEQYLLDEVGVRPGSAEGTRRVVALREALGRMGELAELYELALGLACAPLAGARGASDARDVAGRLLARLDRALNPAEGWAKVPELALVRALLHAERAARARGLGCEVAYAREAALSPFDALGARGGEAVDVGAELGLARGALEDARRRGLGAAWLGPVERCLARVAAAPARVGVAPGGARAARGGAGEVAVERLALAAERLCARAGAPSGAAGIAVARGEDGARCFRVAEAGGLEVALLAPASGPEGARATWAGACELFGRGVGDDGSEAVGAVCPGVDGALPRAWTLFMRGEVVLRVVRVSAP